MKHALAKCIMGLMCLLASDSWAQNNLHNKLDTIQHVDEVVIVSNSTFKEVVPSQKLNGIQLERLNSHNVADALRYFSGLQIKDYGGVGGIKTVNIRSMGTNHLGIYYDGVELGNAQNGQIDLGQFSLDNVEEITLYNGQKSAIFQPASDFANAGSIYIRTKRPLFSQGKSSNMKMKVKYGSSDMFGFSGLWEQKLSNVLSSSLSVGWLSSSGKYKFRYRRLHQDHSVAYDTTAVRQNGDIQALRAEENIHGIINMGAWYLKMYTYHSSRGIPGAIVNNVWRRGERQADHNSFFQGHFQKSIGKKFSTQWMAKYAYYQTHYVNKDTTQLRVDNTYRQQEFYITTSNVYEILPDWSVSLSYDFKWNKLDADMTQFVYPHRFSNFLSVATAIDFKRLKLQASLLGTFVKDHLRKADDPKAIHTLSPSLFVNVYPFNTKDFSLRAFAKKSFRMPTFNDLYYSEIGNALLNPEKAWQYNIGCVYERNWKSQFWKRLHIQLDTYYNTVHDKIIAYPKGQQFRWTMLNLGRVHIKGIDVESELTASPLKDLTMTARLQYTYQQAQDVTSPSTSYYRAQIPYIPWHSGSLTMSIEWKRWNVNYSFIYAGERYNQQDNTVFNYMQPWYTNDLSANYQFLWQHIPCRITLEVNNVFSQDYEVILNYPMPKRNYVISFDIRI